jgi:hypothetical protein
VASSPIVPRPRDGAGGTHQRQRPGATNKKPPRRPISPHSPLVGRQLWRIGDWGGASEQIGRRWEELGSRFLVAMLGVPRPGPDGEAYVPERVLILGAEPELAAQVHSAGKPNADAILFGTLNGRAVLEPVDFKWTLETANPKQVGAEVLEALLTGPPPLLATRLDERLSDLPGRDEPMYQDGFFLAPSHADNRAHLAPNGPLDPTWAQLCEVDAAEFFEPLPGWDVARALARWEGALLRSVEANERFYRLGAGVLGAIRRLRAGLFGEPPTELDGPVEVQRLRQERRFSTIGEMVAYLDRALIARAELVERLRDVERASYPFGMFRQELAARGLPTGGPGAERHWGRLYGSVIKQLGEHLRSEGRSLVSVGRTDAQALAELDASRSRWTTIARRILSDQLADRPAGT